MTQEVLALGVVGGVVLIFFYKGFRAYLAAPLAGWFLRRGRVKLAMKIHPKMKGRTPQKPGCCN